MMYEDQPYIWRYQGLLDTSNLKSSFVIIYIELMSQLCKKTNFTFDGTKSTRSLNPKVVFCNNIFRVNESMM